MSGALAADLLHQAASCEALGSPVYARVLRACADDLRTGGPVAAVLAEHADAARDDLVGLRLLAGVHHRVLTGRAPRLARQYPSTGGTPDDDLVPAFLDVVAGEGLDRWLSHPPQTNEVGRSAALVGGLLLVLGGRDVPVVLHEVGASAGLNLHADRYRFATASPGPGSAAGPWWGTADSPVRLDGAWLGRTPRPGAPLRVVERHGSDIAPVDLSVPGAPERLLAYVWADQVPRVDRTRAALGVATAHPVRVQRLTAREAVRRVRLREGHLTVVWHSVMWQYLPADERRDVDASLDELGSTATAEAPLARLSLEPAPGGAPGAFPVSATVWPGGRTTVLGHAPAHGLPCTWLAHDDPLLPTLGA